MFRYSFLGTIPNFLVWRRLSKSRFKKLGMVPRKLYRNTLRRRRRRLRRMRVAPYAWTLPRPAHSWFDVHYNDPLIPQEYFRQQLRVNKATFVVIRNILGPRLQRQNSKFRDCLPPEKVLALGLYRLAHGNSYLTIAPVFNVGKSTVIDCDCVLLYSFSSEVPALCDCVRS